SRRAMHRHGQRRENRRRRAAGNRLSERCADRGPARSPRHAGARRRARRARRARRRRLHQSRERIGALRRLTPGEPRMSLRDTLTAAAIEIAESERTQSELLAELVGKIDGLAERDEILAERVADLEARLAVLEQGAPAPAPAP